MARQDQGRDTEDRQPDVMAESLERLREELGRFAGAQLHRLTGGAKDRAGMVAGAVGGRAKDAAGSAVGKAGDRVKEAADKAGGGKGGAKGGKFTSIIETLDVGVPLRACYDYWCEYDQFSGFMKGVQSVDREDDDITSSWKAKIGPSTRDWKATVKEQVPDDRIEWTSEGSRGSTRGVVSFHELAPSLTRIVVVVQYYPAGFFEKTANLWRAQGRRLRLDLKHFQRYVTLEAEEEAEGWRGEIREGEVVRSHEEGLADDEEDEDEDEEFEDEEDEGEDEEEGDEEDGEDEGGGKPRGGRRRR